MRTFTEVLRSQGLINFNVRSQPTAKKTGVSRNMGCRETKTAITRIFESYLVDRNQ